MNKIKMLSVNRLFIYTLTLLVFISTYVGFLFYRLNLSSEPDLEASLKYGGEQSLGVNSYVGFTSFPRLSPFEDMAMTRWTQMWPELFNTLHPPQTHRMPEFYDQLEILGQRTGLSTDQRQRLRRWAVLANTFHLDVLSSDLEAHRPNAEQLQKTPCDLNVLEWTFRWAQAQQNLALYPEHVHQYSCQLSPAQSALLDFESALEDRDLSALQKLQSKLGHGSNVVDSSHASVHTGGPLRVPWQDWATEQILRLSTAAIAGLSEHP